MNLMSTRDSNHAIHLPEHPSMTAPVCVWNAHARLGEGPVWSVARQCLYWVDILERRLFRLAANGDRASWRFDEEISSVAERRAGAGLIVTLRHGFAYFDPASESLTHLVQPEAHLPANRFNDGKCDARGRYWAGTIDFDCRAPTGSLYRLTPEMQVEAVDSGYVVTNGPAWSLDGRTLYHNDSVNGRVYAFDFDMERGQISNKRLFLQFSGDEGFPDGMTVDAGGGLWIAHWGASKVTRRDAQGALLQTVTLPCSQVSSCTFGGPDMRTLYITTARKELTPEQLEREPLAGGLFAIELEVAGLPAQSFDG